MPKVEIHLEISVPSDRLDVNQVMALCQEIHVLLGPALVASYLVGILFPGGLRFGLFDLLAIALGIFVAVTRLR